MAGVSVLIKRDGKYLMIQQPESKELALKWRLPGGEIEQGETPEFAAIRKVKEEVDLEIEIIKELALIPSADGKPTTLHFILAEWKSGEINPDPSEIKDFGWFDADFIKRLDLIPATGVFFEKYLK